MHVNLVTLELLIFAPLLCHNIDSITLLRKSSFIIEHTSFELRLSKNERNQALEMLMVGATKQHVANAFGCSVYCHASCATSAGHRKCKGPSSTRSATCNHVARTNRCVLTTFEPVSNGHLNLGTYCRV